MEYCNVPYYVYIITCILLGSATGDDTALYPFGIDADDSTIDDSTRLLPINLPTAIKYFGRSFSTLYISKDGYVSFNPNTTYIPKYWRENPKEHNYPFIAPYYYNGEPNTADTTDIPGTIYYRSISVDSDPTFLLLLEQYMITNVVGVKLFTADTAVVVTWVDVTDVTSAADGCQGNTCTQTNTFQLVIVGGKSQTFAIFNYGKMDSTGHTFYQAGMNGGYNTGWTDVYCDDDCSSTKLNQLPNLQGSDVVGRFIYQVSEEVIIRGGCLPPNSPSGKLEFYPKFANMYGGEIIEISGYCTPQPGVQATCKFGFAEETQAMIFPNSPKIHCEVPKLTERGVVNLVVTQSQQTLTGHFHIVLFGRSNHHVYPINPQNPERVVWNETNPEELSLKWDIAGLNDVGGSATVDINLIGYREDENGFYWELLDVLGKDVLNAEGQYTFKTADHQCKGDQCWMYEIGVVEVRLPRQYWTASTKNSSYTYGVVPLGWFVRGYMEQTYGTDWNSQKCQEWYEKDKINMAWQEELLACPCNLNQAITDFGRWQPDVGCNMYTGSACHYHIGAIHCIRSVNPTASGAGNQCCYNEDGSLKYAADSYQGSTPDRAHDWGAPPFNKPGYVPSLSHWIHDVISFYHCCLWVEYQQCGLYMEQRATRDCKNYSPPKTAFIYGDPHITTFDGVSYDFYGKGEYWLLKHDQLSIHGRFEDTHLPYTPPSPINITVLSGVVMKAPGSSVVEIRFNSPARSSGPVLNVIVNNKARVFGGPEPEWQDYIGVSVVQNNVGYNSKPQSNFTIMFESGVGVLVAAVDQLLHLTVVIPPEFKESTSGLLGTWDDDMENDFRLPDGTQLPTDSSPQDIYTHFALSWGIHDTSPEKIFQFPQGYDAKYIPTIMDQTPIAPTANDFSVKERCVGDQRCIHDYRLTGSEQIGLATLHKVQWIQNVGSYQVKVPSCGLLSVANGVKDNMNYTLGNVVRITGCTEGSLSGDTRYTCIQSGDGQIVWDPSVSASCNGSPDEGNIGIIIGATVAVVVIVAVVVVVVILLIRHRRNTNEKETDDESGEPLPSTAMMRPKPAPRTGGNGDKRNSAESKASQEQTL